MVHFVKIVWLRFKARFVHKYEYEYEVAVLCVRFMYACKDPREPGYIFLLRELSFLTRENKKKVKREVPS